MIESDQAKAEHLYKTICQQLHNMRLIDETYKMSEFDLMRSQYQRALYQLATVARGQTEIPLKLQSVWPLSDSTNMHWSRYHREFDELNFVAGGGFGRVYRARNKLDGIEYAIKKVTIKYQKVNRVLNHLDEVKTFASLNHNNIVPYKAAWLEPLFDSPASNRPSVTDAKHLQRKHIVGEKRYRSYRFAYCSGQDLMLSVILLLFSLSIHNFFFFRNSVKKTSKRSSICLTIFEADVHTTTATTTATTTITDDDESDSESDSSESDNEIYQSHLRLPTNLRGREESSDFIQFQTTGDDNDDAVDGANLSAMKATTPDQRICKPTANQTNNNLLPGGLEFNESQPHLKLKWATLYIQMSFRPLTLRAWLDERNKHPDFNIFYQKFIRQSVQQWERTVTVDYDGVGSTVEAGAIAEYSDRIRRHVTVPLSPTLEINCSKTWDMLDVTLDIFVQALSGLRYIHLQSIVHHDIKPSNIFIGCEKNGELYVEMGDFGLACPLNTKHSPGSIIGTTTYAAPEQLNGQCNPKVK